MFSCSSKLLYLLVCPLFGLEDTLLLGCMGVVVRGVGVLTMVGCVARWYNIVLLKGTAVGV